LAGPFKGDRLDRVPRTLKTPIEAAKAKDTVVRRHRLKKAKEKAAELGTVDVTGPKTASIDLDADVAQLTPEQRVALAARGVLRQAQEARTDLSKFYEFVIRHETTKQRLKVAAHQRLMFAFAVDHHSCVIRQPIGTGKTFGMAAFGLFLMGQDATQRGAIVSKTQQQAAKVLRMLSDYIVEPTLNASLIAVFPHMKPGAGATATWTQSAITIERPPGIRDASAVALGVDGAIGGARISWLLGDDILDADNCLTAASREQVHSRFDARILSRIDPSGGRAVITNTPWNREDLTFQLELAGWPTLTMDIYGYIRFTNVDPVWIMATGLVRPSTKREGWYRLPEHGADIDELVPLWPARYSLQQIEELRRLRLPQEFARLYLCQPFDEGSTRCRREWVDACKLAGNGQWSGGPVKYDRNNPIYTGVDLAIGQKGHHDETAMVTFELLPDRRRRLLDVETGRWTGPQIMERITQKHDHFGSVVVVESNNGQDFIRQFAQQARPDMRIRAHNTNQTNKYSIDFGVESMFTEMMKAAWVFPCDQAGVCPPGFEKLFEECMFYQGPPAHTGDRLMAMWIAREGSRRGGGGRDPKPRAGLKLEFASGGGF
jgi:hypothetical protein